MSYNDKVEKCEEVGYNYFKQEFGNYYKIERTREGAYYDLFATAITDTGKTYLVEVKVYCDEEHPRPYDKYNKDGIDKGYQIDMDKIEHLCTAAEHQGRKPVLYVHFSDCSIVWIPSEINYKERKKRMKVNKYGLSYGSCKEYTDQTYFYKSEATYVKEWTQ